MTIKHKGIFYGFLAFIVILLVNRWCSAWAIEGYDNQQLKYVHTTLLRMLGLVLPIFKKHQLYYWADGGTLLGCIREGAIIPWDDDIDLALRKDDFTRLRRDSSIHDDLNAVGLTLLGKGNADHSLMKIVMKQPDNDYSKNKIFIDIMCYHREKDKYILSCFHERLIWPKSYYMVREVERVSTKRFHHLPINIPSEPIRFLKRFYGDDWKTPKKDHDHESEVNLKI